MYGKDDVRDYLKTNFDNLKEAGNKYGVSPSTMSAMQCGRQHPSQVVSEHIKRERDEIWRGTGYKHE